jgi:hypothetical protein
MSRIPSIVQAQPDISISAATETQGAHLAICPRPLTTGGRPVTNTQLQIDRPAATSRGPANRGTDERAQQHVRSVW